MDHHALLPLRCIRCARREGTVALNLERVVHKEYRDGYLCEDERKCRAWVRGRGMEGMSFCVDCDGAAPIRKFRCQPCSDSYYRKLNEALDARLPRLRLIRGGLSPELRSAG
jgi:hypothetical protein